MDQIMVPSLSVEGWLTNVPAAIDAIFTYYLTTDVTTSNFYVLNSMNQTQANVPNDMSRLAATIEADLTKMFSGYFDTANVYVVAESGTSNNLSGSSAIYNMNISATLILDGQSYDFAQSLGSVDGKWVKLQNYNGTGL